MLASCSRSWLLAIRQSGYILASCGGRKQGRADIRQQQRLLSSSTTDGSTRQVLASCGTLADRDSSKAAVAHVS